MMSNFGFAITSTAAVHEDDERRGRCGRTGATRGPRRKGAAASTATVVQQGNSWRPALRLLTRTMLDLAVLIPTVFILRFVRWSHRRWIHP